MDKKLLVSGGFAPSTLTRGSAPRPRWGIRPRPPFRLALRELAMVPLGKSWMRHCTTYQPRYLCPVSLRSKHQLKVHGRARREAARRRKSECQINFRKTKFLAVMASRMKKA